MAAAFARLEGGWVYDVYFCRSKRIACLILCYLFVAPCISKCDISGSAFYHLCTLSLIDWHIGRRLYAGFCYFGGLSYCLLFSLERHVSNNGLEDIGTHKHTLFNICVFILGLREYLRGRRLRPVPAP